ncbi:hypothetical protein MHA_2157 [Mannheimia haemolytica PHL213]|nr:hypothetical protein MHA_2157 [Mannheimia haemolytica PHL213]
MLCKRSFLYKTLQKFVRIKQNPFSKETDNDSNENFTFYSKRP